MGSPHGEPAVRVRHSDDKNCSGEEWKGLKIVSKRSFSPSGNAGERLNALFPRAGSPPIASLPAQQVRHDDDVQDAEDYTCGEQAEFDGHLRGYTNSVTPWSVHDPIPKRSLALTRCPGKVAIGPARRNLNNLQAPPVEFGPP